MAIGQATSTSFFRFASPFFLTSVFFLAAQMFVSAQNTPADRIIQQQGVLQTKSGPVEFAVPGGDWQQATQGQRLLFNHRVRTLAQSRAALRLDSLTVVQLSESTTVEILPPPPQGKARLDLIGGFLRLFTRRRSGEVSFQTPLMAGGNRGTEFSLKVDEATGRTVLTVADGAVDVTTAETNLAVNADQVGTFERGRPPEIRAVLQTENIVQWWLYYPGVLDLDELAFTPTEKNLLAGSLAAYRAGHLVEALQRYPQERGPNSEPERLYYAALLLAVGQVEKTEALLQTVNANTPQARALRRMIAAVNLQTLDDTAPPETASEWLAQSYYEQSRTISDDALEKALSAAEEAVKKSPRFGFALERVAELEFSYARTGKAMEKLDQALAVSPDNPQAYALKGFLLAAENRLAEGVRSFNHAIQLDGSLGNAWLGRGLIRIRQGQAEAGRADLQMAAALEPNRSLLRSYLGKAFSNAKDDQRARQELELAKKLDPNDPTPWLYSALLRRQDNEINSAVRELEKSVELNDNRRLYRSRLLLDQDHAVRSANLAHIYLDAGMTDVSVREAAKGVSYDYANYSAHLFLADSYDALRDPTRFNLRYETVWFNELLLANILAPVGGARLSQAISAQEYSRLFESDGLGLASSTTMRTDGIVRERASQFGTIGKTAYALDLDYQHHNGVRANNELDSIEWYSTVKQQVTPQDTALILVKYEDYHSGDNFQYYDPQQARRNFSFDEKQEPILVGAWHHEWSPGMHTMFLGGRLINEQRFNDQNVPQIVLLEDVNGTVDGSASPGFDVDYHSQFEIYSVELNQICNWKWLTLSAGARFQSGTFETRNLLSNPTSVPFLVTNVYLNSTEDGFERITGYGYVILKLFPQLRLTGGLAYDQETIPRNFRHPPVSPGEDDRSHVGPKAAFHWTPLAEVTVRGIYTRSLGGISLDESYRLEPTQLAGFPQAFRSVISESVVGSVSAPTYETFGLALDLKLGSRTYAGIQAERITSEIRRRIGVLTVQTGVPPATVESIGERLDYEERTLAVSLNQLLGDGLVVGASYRLTWADLQDTYPGTPASVLTTANPSQRATLHRASGYFLYNHLSGFFARAEAHWYAQRNSGYSPGLPGDDFFQENIYVGYRFARGRGELRLGILNLTDEDYRLNPLTVYEELPRERVFEARLSFRF